METEARPLRFTPALLARPVPSGIDVVTTLHDFAILTWAIPPERLRPHVHERFALTTVRIDGFERALLSAVPFEDHDFRAGAFPSPRFRFGQTNYRAYVVDRETGEHAAWFFGTVLDSWSVVIPRFVWKLPWHRGRVRFDCARDESGSYRRWCMKTVSRWASCEVELADLGQAPRELAGFSNLESGWVVLTHPLVGYYWRRDGTLGTYRIWHERIAATAARATVVRFDLLDRLGLVPFAEQRLLHSALLTPRVEFQVQLPPRASN